MYFRSQANRDLMYLSSLTDVEVTASVMRAFPDDPSDGLRVVRNYRDDCALGVFRKVTLDDAVFLQAQRLEERYTTTLNLKSVDLLHLATAVRYGVPALGSFDKRLREAAKALGLAVLPA